MDTTSYIALSRQMALQNKMTVIAGNIANMSTTAFKAEHLGFETVRLDGGTPKELSYVHDRGKVRDLAPGALVPTGNALDVAIDGPGYLAVETPDGIAYGRDGHLALDAFGELVDANGFPVLDDGGAPIAVPAGAGEVTIAEDGTISTADGILGRLQLVTFADEQQMERAGSSLYRTDQAAEPVERPRMLQGYLEGSNVNGVLEMTTMMETVRAFQGTQKMLETHHDIVRRSVEQMLSTEA